MAVEMCKLSLWLVSLDKSKPFSFVDDKIFCGNSLLGVTSLDQLRHLHVDPERKRKFLQPFVDVDAVLGEAARLRRELASTVDEDDPQRSTYGKARLLRRADNTTAQLRLIADSIIAAGLVLGGTPGVQLEDAYKSLEWALGEAFPQSRSTGNRKKLDQILTNGLTPTVKTDYDRWQPLHWAIEVPDVMDAGGFDAIIGNPPFLGGQKLTAAMGTNARDWLVNVLAGETRGSADLVAYFFLRAHSLLSPTGTLGLIATNTIAQGDTREVGLDRMTDSGFTIIRAIQSRSWPAATVNLQFASVWGTRATISDEIDRFSDDFPVARISTLLEPAGRVSGHPYQLAENKGIAFQGCNVLGMGFVIDPDEAQDWITADRANKEVLFPYLVGEDLNSRPDCTATRWVIDFNDRTEAQAARYVLPFERALTHVKPIRAENNRKVYRDYWWQFAEKRPAMRKAISQLENVLVLTQTSKTLMPMLAAQQIYGHKLVVFATERLDDLAVLSSTVHQMWAMKYGSSMRTDFVYTPSDVFLTFPRPSCSERLKEAGKALHSERREIMLRRDLGLTALYNLVNDPGVTSDKDVTRIRDIHVEIDSAVLASYGWRDLRLDHGHHTYRLMERFTVAPRARVEILDRLLRENHRRAGLQDGGLSDQQEGLFK
ncbi:hypothetical protein A5658_11445 [Mycobacterium sp. 1245111.1]|nr:hypothetical protein A5658_11445 [Mycobacterium sp. 1245111.1]